jgi:DNA-binding NarL/FixJ family response regulator
VILDAVLPDVSGLDVLADLVAERPGVRALMVTAHARPELVREALARGARGFVTKGTPLAELREGVARVLGGGRYFCSVTSQLLSEALASPAALGRLTRRQREIVQRVASGQSSKQIAGELGISLKTVANHRLQIRERLGMSDVASWTRYAIEHGLIEPKV